MTLSEAHALLRGSTLVGDGSVPIGRVHSDTRTLQSGDLFVALRGEHFDANDFLAEAGLPGLLVKDSKRALGELAKAWRARMQLPLVAVTGSNGKTTVTQMLASVLAAWVGGAAFSTQGNFNNDIGVPLTLLRLRQDALQCHRAGVVELGMNHPGEIAWLAEMTAPTVALVNNAQREHQEFMAGVEAVARENGAVIEALGLAGVAVYPADDEFAPLWRGMAGSRSSITFALQGTADVMTEVQWVGDHWSLALHTPAGSLPVRLRIAGLHNVKNALAVTACALAAGVPLDAVARGLEAFEPVKGRSQLKTATVHGQPVTLVDDTYNANPDSARAAVDVLSQMAGPRWFLLGDMGEVGDQGPAFHEEVGAYAQAQGVEHFWTVGTLCRHAAAAFTGARHFESVAGLIAALSQAPQARAVLVKGSRFMKMEQVVAALSSPTPAEQQGKPHAA